MRLSLIRTGALAAVLSVLPFWAHAQAVDPVVAAAQAQKAQSDALTAQYQAQQAAIQARTAAATAAANAIPDTGIHGETTAGTNAGRAESLYLSVAATQAIADGIKERLGTPYAIKVFWWSHQTRNSHWPTGKRSRSSGKF